MLNKEVNLKSNKKKTHKMQVKKSKTRVSKAANRKTNHKRKTMPFNKNQLSTHSGKTQITNHAFHYPNTSTSSKLKTRFSHSRGKMSRSSSYVPVSFMDVAKIPFIRFLRLPGCRNLLNCLTLERVIISYLPFT